MFLIIFRIGKRTHSLTWHEALPNPCSIPDSYGLHSEADIIAIIENPTKYHLISTVETTCPPSPTTAQQETSLENETSFMARFRGV